jgi:hypothetical protein
MTAGRKDIVAALVLALCAAVASPTRALASAVSDCATACQHSKPMAPCQHDCCAYQRQDDEGLRGAYSKVGGRLLRATLAWDAPLAVPRTPALVVPRTRRADSGPPLFVRLLTIRC